MNNAFYGTVSMGKDPCYIQKFFFLTALLTITHVTYSKLNSQKEMKYMCKMIESDKVKRAGANGMRGPMRGTSHDTNNN